MKWSCGLCEIKHVFEVIGRLRGIPAKVLIEVVRAKRADSEARSLAADSGAAAGVFGAFSTHLRSEPGV